MRPVANLIDIDDDPVGHGHEEPSATGSRNTSGYTADLVGLIAEPARPSFESFAKSRMSDQAILGKENSVLEDDSSTVSALNALTSRDTASNEVAKSQPPDVVKEISESTIASLPEISNAPRDHFGCKTTFVLDKIIDLLLLHFGGIPFFSLVGGCILTIIWGKYVLLEASPELFTEYKYHGEEAPQIICWTVVLLAAWLILYGLAYRKPN